MLLFSSGTFTVGGITVFPDHADPNQFWYLPGPVGLAKQPDSDEPQFLLIMYTPDVASTGIKGVGFLNVTLALTLSDTTHDDIVGQIRKQFPDVLDPRLTPVPFDEGSVQIVSLDLQGSGGTSAAPPRDGTFVAVETIHGSVSPELFGDNNAIFALTLSEDGASILEQAFEDGMAPVGGIYTLKFTGVRPALDVKITADLKRVFDAFSVGLEAKVYWVSAGIDATFEKLKQDGAIKVEVVNLTTDSADADKEQWALNLFKDQILSTWFQPSLSPTGAATGTVPTTTTTKGGGTQPVKPSPPTGTGTGTSTSPGGMQPPKPPTGGITTPGGMQPPKPAPGVAPLPTGIGDPTTPAPVPTPTPNPAAPAAPGSPTVAPGVAPGKPPSGGVSPAGVAGAIAGAQGTATAASSAASPFGVSLKMTYTHQEELKTVTIEYNRMDAVQRVYAPQGYFGVMLNKLDQSKHFLKVDGTDPFFNEFVVTINPPRDFAGIGLLSAHVAIDYGDPSDADRSKHGEFIFDSAHPGSQVWQIYEGMIQDTEFRYTVDYKFDPESGWQGERTAYFLPTVTTENRLLSLDPYDFLGFLPISITPGKIDWGAVDRIEVPLQYASKSGWETSTTIILRPDSQPQVWKLRLADKHDRSYTYSTTCFFKDGSSFKTSPVTTTANSIVVSDPFMSALNLTFQPVLDPSKTKLAAVEIAYRDDSNNYSFESSFEVAGNVSTPTKIHIPVIDEGNKVYQYRLTLISTGNQKSQGDYITAQDSLVLLTDQDAA
jgi:hypothetical protein